MSINSSKYIDALKQKQYSAIIHSSEYKALLNEMCKRIIEKSTIAPNEATIESYFECELFAFFRDVFVPIGFEYNPIKESPVSTLRHVTKGRADTYIGALVIEFKQPATLTNDAMKQKSITQITEYLLGIKMDTDMVGYITDGLKGCFVTYNDTGIIVEDFCSLSREHLDRLIQSIIRLKLTTLSSTNLVYDFCNPPENNGAAFKLVKTLFSNLLKGMTQKTQMLFNEWKELFSLAHDDISKQQAIIDRKTELQKLLDVCFLNNDDEYKALFALQTAYAIIIKIVAYRILSIVRYNNSFVNFEGLVDTDSNALRHHLSILEDGAIFREYGITNLLEGDFFSWYSSNEQWSNDIAQSISDVFKILSMYIHKSVLNTSSKSTDFFKELYHGMMPSAVRHSLGEYYTKRWVAQQVFDEALQLSGAIDWKGLEIIMQRLIQFNDCRRSLQFAG